MEDERTTLVSTPLDDELDSHLAQDSNPTSKYKSRRRKISISVIVFSIVVLIMLIALIAILVRRSHMNKEKAEIQVVNILKYLADFEAIAQSHNNSRSVANGYNETAQYVITALSQTDYLVSTQNFVVPIYSEFQPPNIMQVNATGGIVVQFMYEKDFTGLPYGGNSTFDITSDVVEISNYGCSLLDFPNANGKVVIIESDGPCATSIAALNAQESGAKAALFWLSNGQLAQKLFWLLDIWGVNGTYWKQGDPLVQIPLLSITSTLRQVLLGNKVRIQGSNTIQFYSTYNVFAETKSGSNDVIMFGAHLDSVAAGPGINDNGSGSATLLELALILASSNIGHTTKVRFAWWGAEELGLMGSRFYVDNMNDLSSIALYFNFDMMASPNYIYSIGNGTTGNGAQQGSITLQHLLENIFQQQGLNYRIIRMGDDTDYDPFINTNIPSNGLATGALSIKNAHDKQFYGGIVNAQLDPCYHLPCDTTDNINQLCLTHTANIGMNVMIQLIQQNDIRAFLNGNN